VTKQEKYSKAQSATSNVHSAIIQPAVTNGNNLQLAASSDRSSNKSSTHRSQLVMTEAGSTDNNRQQQKERKEHCDSNQEPWVLVNFERQAGA